jgi:hypothetical protein
MLRPPLTIASALSLLLCMAALALLIHSDGRRDELRVRWLGSKYAVASERGELLIDNSPEIDDRVARQIPEAEILNTQAPALYKQWLSSGRLEDWTKLQTVIKQYNSAPGRTLHSIRYAIPDWLLAFLALILPVAWAWKWNQQRPLAAAGLCPHCGYDLRASKDRCPECGSPIRSTSVTAEKSVYPS